jgi:hypothetical protein
MFRALLNRGRPFNPGSDSHLITIDIPAVAVPDKPRPITRFINRAWEVLKATADEIFRLPLLET